MDCQSFMNRYYNFALENKNVKYSVSLEPLPPTSVVHKWVGAQLEKDVLYAIPNDMNAILKRIGHKNYYLGDVGTHLFKWTGGCIWNGSLYGYPRTSDNMLKMSLKTEKIEYIASPYGYRQEHHYGGVCTENGIVYQPPRDSDHILVWNLKTEKTKRIYLNLGHEKREHRYCGSLLHPGGYVYFFPEMQGKVIKLDIKTNNWRYIGDLIDAMVFDAKIAIDGNIYGYSAYCRGLIKVDVRTDKVEMIHKEINPGAYGTKLGVNGHLYSIPGDGECVWDYNPFTDSLRSIYDFSHECKAKYAGGATMKNGNIYGVPAKGKSLLQLKANIAGIDIPSGIFLKYYLDCY